MRIVVLVSVLLCLMAGFAGAAEPPVTYEKESMVLEPDTYELGEFTVELYADESGLQIKEQRDRGQFVHATWGFETIHDRIGQVYNFTDRFYFRLDDVFFEDGERRYDVTMWHREDVFAQTDVVIDLPDYIQLRPGTESLSMSIENNGLVNESYFIEEELPDGISASYSYQGYNVSRVRVEAGETASVSVTLDIEEEVSPGFYDLEFRASDRSSDTERIEFELLGEDRESSFSFDVGSSFSRVETGNNVTFDVRFYNAGETVLENVTTQVATPDTWEHWVRLENTSLESGERRRGTVTVYVPNGVSTGDQFIDVSGSVNGLEAETAEVRIAVIDRGQEGIVGIGLALGSLLVLVLVYKLFGRR